MDRYICIHGHFYQPPRENAWLEEIEVQDSAQPYHDWNERITAECYGPNTAARILDEQNRIVQIVNNYSRISFDFGPTLLIWMEQKAPEVYRSILDSDKESQRLFSGHGSAMAQAYNHMILPLANRRDKYTQILWGIRDFEHRFGRSPEGMWLPETAVDVESLEIMAELGIAFTVLSPSQAKRVRPLAGGPWQEVNGARIDGAMPYKVGLPSGKSIAVFFYDGPISRAVAFEHLLSKGEDLANRLVGAFQPKKTSPQLVHIATDGETYGHHHHFGEMALAYALNYIESKGLAKITNFGEYLEKNPPTHEVEILERTSWSCAHGVERWRSDCGCNVGSHPGWTQEWRAPLRGALDWLRDQLAPRYEEAAGKLLKDPWAARNEYIDVVLDRSLPNVQKFLGRHAVRRLTNAEKTRAIKLLGIQRNAMLMYTSCAWFFDDISGIEAQQVLQYAGRVMQLGEEVFGRTLEPQFLELLEHTKGNIPEQGDGRRVYERYVRPAMVDLKKVAAHFAVSSLFDGVEPPVKVYCYDLDLGNFQRFEAGKRAKLVVGHARVTSTRTWESGSFTFGALHYGDHNVSCAVREFGGEEAYRSLTEEMSTAFSKADFPEVLRLMYRHFGESTYSLRSLFKDEQRKVLGQVLKSPLESTEAAYRQLFEQHAPMMRFLVSMDVPLPRAFRVAADFFLNSFLRKALATRPLDAARVTRLAAEARALKIDLDTRDLGSLLTKTLEGLMEGLPSSTGDQALLNEAVEAVGLARSLPFEVDLWKVQNLYWAMLQSEMPAFSKRAKRADQAAKAWLAQFAILGERLSIRA